VVSTLNLVDRFLPGVLAQPIKQDLALSDTALGLINGFGFLIIYAVMGVPIARIADRGAYGVVISGCIAFWSVMTAIGGLAHSGWQLALTRMGVAVGEAGNTPASQAFVSRSFAPERRAAPLAVLSASSPIAFMLGLVGGGLIGQAFGWRSAFIVMGAAGLVLAPIVWTVLRGTAAASLASTRDLVSRGGVTSLLKKRSYLVLLAATAFIGMSGYGMNAFGPAYLMRTHGMSVGDVAVQYGFIHGAAGTAGLLLTSFLADRAVSRDARWPLWIVVAMLATLLPFTVIAFTTTNKWVAIVSLALSNTTTVAYQAPVVASVHRLAPVNLRATASAVLLFATAVVGGGGPLIIGIVSDALAPLFGSAALSHALLVIPPMLLTAAMLFLTATRSYLPELAECEDAVAPDRTRPAHATDGDKAPA
jgi:predicted MFS family arabinose efflux permease